MLLQQTCFLDGRQLSLEHQPDHLDETDVPDKFFNVFTPDPDPSRTHVDDFGAPPVSNFSVVSWSFELISLFLPEVFQWFPLRIRIL